jgi:parvulin-like peptidyl-prolyl isomerase
MMKKNGLWSTLTAVAAFSVLAGQALGQASKPLAVVNGEAITTGEVDAILKQQPPSPTPLTEAQKQQGRKEALDFMINEMVMKQFLQRQFAGRPSIAPNSGEVNKRVAELVADLDKKKSTLQQFLKDSGQTETQLRANIVKEIQWEVFCREHLTDTDLKNYYDAYRPFFDKIVVRASHILFRLGEGAKDIDRQVARNKLLGLRQDIVAGKIDFAEAAKKYSDCPTKVNGGDVGFFPRKFVVLEPFAQAAFALKVGDMSDVVETDYGLHLIKVVDRSPGETSDFTKIKEEVRKIYMMELGMNLLAQERKKAKIQILMP